METAEQILESQRIRVSDAKVDLGDNHFLSHATHEIRVIGEHVGDALVSFYDFGSAGKLKVARNWLARPDSYLAQFKKYLFMPEKMVATLPHEIELSDNGSGKLLIVDEIVLQPGYTAGNYEAEILQEIVAKYERHCAVLLLPKWQSLGRRLGMRAEEQLEFYAGLGFLAIDGAMMARTGSL